MWTLTKRFRFEAAHRLPNHHGKCKRLHGHSWQGEIVVGGGELVTSGSETDMVMDYARINAEVQPLIDMYLDHHYLNETLAHLAPLMPTSEVIARWIYDTLKPALPSLQVVRIDETCTCRCEYRG